MVKLFAVMFKESFFIPEGIRIQAKRGYELFHSQYINYTAWLKEVTQIEQ